MGTLLAAAVLFGVGFAIWCELREQLQHEARDAEYRESVQEWARVGRALRRRP